MKSYRTAHAVSVVSALAVTLALLAPPEMPGAGKPGAGKVAAGNLMISSPRKDTKVPPEFVASGSFVASKKVAGKLTSDAGADIQGTTIRQPAKDGKQAPWAIYFKNIPLATYTLTVWDLANPKKAKQVPNVTVVAKTDVGLKLVYSRPGSKGKIKPRDVTLSPSSGNMDCLTAYSPYGYFSPMDTTITSTYVQFQNTDMSLSEPIGTYYNFVDPMNSFWYGQFPDLTTPYGEGYYQLNVTGDAGGTPGPYLVQLLASACGN
jgi:hypothetical protein